MATDLKCGLLGPYSGRSVLITGGLGFVGSAIVDTLCLAESNVTLFVRPGQAAKQPKVDQPAPAFIEGDLNSDEDWTRALIGADYVMHLAAQTSSRQADEDPLADINANVTPAIRMLEVCRTNGFKPRIVIAGTATQVGIPEEVTVDEYTPDRPASVYDINKLMAEKYLEFYSIRYNIPGSALRLANVYGPGRPVGSSDRGIMNLMIRRAEAGEPLTVYGTGEWTRDYVYIDDVVTAFLHTGAATDRTSGNHYLVGSGEGIRFVDALHLVAERAELSVGFRPEITFAPPPTHLTGIDQRNFIADTSALTAATSWRPQVDITEGIDRTIAFYRSISSVQPGEPISPEEPKQGPRGRR